MGSSRRKRRRRPARGPSSRSARRRLLVVCEGEVTEPTYIEGFVGNTRNATVEVRIHGEHGDPRRLVDMAKGEKQRAEAQARRQDDEFLAYDEVWCAFDRDQHERFDDACQMARANQLELAVCNPCIELWLYLHFCDSPGARHRHDVQKMLKKFLPGYDKHLVFKDVAGLVDVATERARRLDRDAERMNEAFRNPTAGFFRLIESIARVEPAAPSTGSMHAGDFEPRRFDLYFQNNRAKITRDHRRQLAAALALLARHARSVAVIEGHAGVSEAGLEQLIQCRIDAVKAYLTTHDIAAERIRLRGTDSPESSNEAEAHDGRRVRLCIELPLSR